MPAGNVTAELTGIAPQSAHQGITNLFTFAELSTIWQTAWSGVADIPYEQFPASDLAGAGTPAASLTRRIVGLSRTQYRSDDLTTLLNFQDLQPTARPGETYTSAFTPGLLNTVFGSLITNADLAEGGYIQLAGQPGWWAPSGRVYYSPDDRRKERFQSHQAGVIRQPGEFQPCAELGAFVSRINEACA